VVAHLADENHVRVLSQRAAQGFGKRARVNVHFSLRDEGLPVLVQKLYGVFDGDYVAAACRVDAVYDGGESG
jgi:hypothetical protein